MEVRLFTLFSRLAQAENWTKTKGFCCSCNLNFLVSPVKFLLHYVAWQSGGQGVVSHAPGDCIVAESEADLLSGDQVRHPDVPGVHEGDQVGIVRTHRGVQTGPGGLGLNAEK